MTRQRGVPSFSFNAKFGLKNFDARSQFRETGVGSVLLFELFKRTCRGSPNGLPSANGFPAKHSRLSSNHSAVFQFAALAKSGLAANDDVLADSARAGETDLCRHDRMRPDLDRKSTRLNSSHRLTS